MKQPKKLTRELKEAVAAYGLAVEQWSFLRIIDKYARKVQKK